MQHWSMNLVEKEKEPLLDEKSREGESEDAWKRGMENKKKKKHAWSRNLRNEGISKRSTHGEKDAEREKNERSDQVRR